VNRALPFKLLAFLVLVSTAWPCAAQEEGLPSGASLEVRVRSGFSPFAFTSTRLAWRGLVMWGTLARRAAGAGETAASTALVEWPTGVTPARVQALAAGPGVWGPRPEPAPDVLVYSVEWFDGAATASAEWRHPDDVPGHEDEWRALGLILGAVEDAAGVPVYADPFLDPGAHGFLDLFSTPAAQVEIDGYLVAPSTPLYTHPLPAGKHKLVLRNHATGREREYEFTIQAGGTTILDLDLF
jgi:hypothetical protein